MTLRDDGPFLACGIAAFALRVVDLGRDPLSIAEAIASWTAAVLAHGGTLSPLPPMGPPDSAALVAVQTVVFSLFGDSDRTARFGVGCIGALAALLPWVFERTLGRRVAIALAVLLAADPILVGYARLADGAAITMTAVWAFLLALIGTLHEVRDRETPAALYGAVGAVAAGVAAISGPLVWDFMLPIGACWLVLRRDQHPSRTGIRIAAVTACVVATTAFTHTMGASYVSAGLTAWIRSWWGASHLTWQQTVLMIARAEAFPLAMAATALVLARTRARPDLEYRPEPRRIALLAVVWVAWGVLVTLRSGRTPASWLVLQPPVLLAAAWATAEIVARLRFARPWRLAVVSASAGLLAVQFVGGAVNVATGNDHARFEPYGDRTEPATRLLAQTLESTRYQSVVIEKAPAIEIVAAGGADPVIGWTLRHVANLRWVEAASTATQTPTRYVVVPLAPQEPAQMASTYPLRRAAGILQRVDLQ